MKPSKWNITVLYSGLFCLLLAVVVIWGWITGNQKLIQVLPHFAPMQFNTALGFIFAGLSLVCLYKQKRECSQIAGVLTFVIGLSTLWQYVFNIDLQIDNLFVEHEITTKTSHPGRMAPNTALCFMLSGLALIVRPLNRRLFAGLTASIFLLSLLALAGYLFHSEDLYGWGNLTRMALHTSIGFMFLAAGLFISLVNKKGNVRFDLWSIAPFTLALAIFVMTFFFWHTMKEASEARKETYFHNLIENTEHALIERYTLYEQSLRSGLGLFYASDVVDRKEWELFVRALRVDENLPGINGVGYIDYVRQDNLDSYLASARADGAPEFSNHPDTPYEDKFIIKYIEPVYRNVQAVGLDIGFEENRREAAERARDTGLPSLTRTIKLVQDNKRQAGFLLLIPVYDLRATPEAIDGKRQHFKGWVYAPFMGSNFMHGLTDISRGQLNIAVYDGSDITQENLIYQNTDLNDNAQFTHTTELKIAGRDWTVVWQTSEDFNPPDDQIAPVILAIFGGLFGVLVYFAFNRMMLSRATIAHEVERQTAEITKNRQDLENMNSELMRSNKELERFAYIASHDLQEPLRKIGGFTERLNQKFEGQLDEQAETYMRFVLDGVERMRGLIQGLLAYSRISTEAVEIEPQDSNEIVRLATENLSERIKETNATITYDNLPTVPYDKVMFTQLFQNLIGNAMKYKADRDPVINITAKDLGDRWEFAVADNGMGMEEKYLERIFTMFQRLHRKEDIPGTGIGLSLCQKIVERYGGRIYVTSTPDVGSTFYFTVLKGEPDVA